MANLKADMVSGAEVCAYCAQPDGHLGRHLVLEPVGFTVPMHQECMDDIARYGSD